MTDITEDMMPSTRPTSAPDMLSVQLASGFSYCEDSVQQMGEFMCSLEMTDEKWRVARAGQRAIATHMIRAVACGLHIGMK
jgi:hypothetical protein